MQNFDPDNQDEIATFILKHLPRHKQFALATVDDEGKPWTVCLNLTYDQDMNIIWKSLKDTEHSRHITRQPAVAVCIFSEENGVGDSGFYCKATVHEVTDNAELGRLLKVRFADKGKETPSLGDFQGEAHSRLYCATIDEAWINDDRHFKAKVDLGILRRHAGK